MPGAPSPADGLPRAPFLARPVDRAPTGLIAAERAPARPPSSPPPRSAAPRGPFSPGAERARSTAAVAPLRFQPARAGALSTGLDTRSLLAGRWERLRWSDRSHAMEGSRRRTRSVADGPGAAASRAAWADADTGGCRDGAERVARCWVAAPVQPRPHAPLPIGIGPDLSHRFPGATPWMRRPSAAFP